MATKEAKAKSPNKRTTSCSISEDQCRRKVEPHVQPQNNLQRSGSVKKGLSRGDGSEDSANENGSGGPFEGTKKRKLGMCQVQNNLEFEIKNEIVDSINEDSSLRSLNGRKKVS